MNGQQSNSLWCTQTPQPAHTASKLDAGLEPAAGRARETSISGGTTGSELLTTFSAGTRSLPCKTK